MTPCQIKGLHFSLYHLSFFVWLLPYGKVSFLRRKKQQWLGLPFPVSRIIGRTFQYFHSCTYAGLDELVDWLATPQGNA